jgi:uncharacterized sulfatase
MRWIATVFLLLLATGATAADRPNILWISAEDISAATVGCYGGLAKTPRIDGLAKKGLRFDAAFSAAPVCAPSRSAIITAMMPTTLGSLPMRCTATPPPFVVGFPTFLREAGYYCTNNSKTDYNFDRSFKPGWNESSNKAHWRNRADKKEPFFAVFNLTVTHESGLFADQLEKRLKPLRAGERADPDALKAPPFYPNTRIVREALAHRLDLGAVLDRDVGKLLDELDADGLADSTIVVFWGDHGEGIPRGKRALTDYGLRVPLIVHVPERFRAAATLPGGGEPVGETNNLVSLMDLGPTMLDLAGEAIPEWREGKSFIGPHAATRDVVIGVADRMDAAPGFGRSVRDARFRYVRNFLPWLDGDDLPDYATGVPITVELRKARAAGTLPAKATWFSRTSRPAEELYDVAKSPYEIHEVAGEAAYDSDRVRLRDALRAWMMQTRDTGILPEPILRREAKALGSEWAIFHPGKEGESAALARYETILAAAWDVADQPTEAPWQERLASQEPAIRFWAVHGIGWGAKRTGGDAVAPARATLEPVLADKDPVAAIAAAWWLVKLGGGDATPALDVLGREMRSDDADVRQQALVAIDQLGEKSRPLWTAAAAIEVGKAHKADEYSRRMIERIRARLDSSPSP